MIRVALSFLVIAFAATAAAKDEEPAAKAPTAGPPPPVVKLRHATDTLDYRLTVRPGVPKPGTAVTVELELSEVLAIPDPMYGRRKPVNDADLRAVLVAAPSGKKRKKSTWAAARSALRLPDAGNYSFTFTADKGVYGLHILGKAGAHEVKYSAVVPFGVWPVPAEWSHDNPPPVPSKEPEALSGDLDHGKALCDERCNKDVEGAYPPNKTPTFLRSDVGAALDDKALLTTMVAEGGPRLTAAERNDLLLYLRSLHRSVTDFFPGAAAIVTKEFTINDHGKKRLQETLKLKLADEDAKAHVFVAYQGERPPDGPKMIPYDDRIARDHLKRGDKLGYLVFLNLPKNPNAAELAIAMDREPSYAIVGISARDKSGKMDKSLNKQLSSFISHGRFNDAGSLRKGSKSLQKTLLPVYLRAAELATMYYAAEREFTEFDAEFGDGEAASVEAGEMGFSKNKRRK